MRALRKKRNFYLSLKEASNFLIAKIIAICFSILVCSNSMALSAPKKPDQKQLVQKQLDQDQRQDSVKKTPILLECNEECMGKVKRLKKYARNGSPEAQTLLAISYRTGEMTEVDPKLAWKWIRPAVSSRYPPALHIISQWYREGYAKEIDIEKADKYLERSAKLKFSPAIFDLAIFNHDQKNFQKSIELFRTAAKLGHPEAKKIVLRLDADHNSSGNQRNAQTSTTQPEEGHGDEENVLTIVSVEEESNVLLENFLNNLKDLGVYNKRGYTGSRVGYRKCGQAGTGCRVIYDRRNNSGDLMEVSFH